MAVFTNLIEMAHYPDENEKLCAEILASMEGIVFKKKKAQSNGIKKTHKRKKASKRNLNACLEHRRRHQKCPMDCPLRLNEEEEYTMMPSTASQSLVYLEAPQTTWERIAAMTQATQWTSIGSR
eukprot:TRINITY_DN435_c0_g1_i1.p1 TRINITY_DN435_c0_g1~~TRINITY_DN435_c0_g1_i1.p1  ORF type:complete len:124 (-),score=27.52 TRINITY_DN435_c0_g1_i1:211-582(-)